MFLRIVVVLFLVLCRESYSGSASPGDSSSVAGQERPRPKGAARDTAASSQEMNDIRYLSNILSDMSVVAISKKKEKQSDAPMAVYIAPREELERWGATSLFEVFSHVPGYSFYGTDYYGQYGPIGRGLQSVWRYGFSFDLMNVVDFGHWDYSPHFFKNVEIARGPAGMMWGSNAMGGLINFNLRDDLHGLETHTETGNFHRFAQDILWGNAIPDASPGDGVFLGWHYEQQDPKVIPSAFDSAQGMASDTLKTNGINPSQFIIGKVQYNGLKLIVFHDHASNAAPVAWFGGRPFQDSIEKINGSRWGDQLDILAYRVEYKLPVDSLSLRPAAIPLSISFYHEYYAKRWSMESVAFDTQKKQSVGFTAHLSLDQNMLDFDAGGDLWGRSSLFDPSYTSRWADSAFAINWYDKTLHPVSEEHQNLYAQTSCRFLDICKVLVGGRVDMTWSPKQRVLVSGPRFGLFVTPEKNITCKYLYNSSARAPQANEVSDGVDPERLNAHELIATVQVNRQVQVNVTLFHQELQNEITRIAVASDLNKFVNIPGVTDKGVEWAINAVPCDYCQITWNGSLNYAQVRKKNFTDTAGLPFSISENCDGKGRPLFLPISTNYVGFSWYFFPGIRVSPGLRYLYRIPYKTVDSTFSEVSGYFVDCTVESKKLWKDRIYFSATVLNALNSTTKLPAYGEHLGNAIGTVQTDGRRISASVHVSF